MSETLKRQKLKICGGEKNKLIDGKEEIKKFLEGSSKILTVFFWQMISWKKKSKVEVNTKLINSIINSIN